MRSAVIALAALVAATSMAVSARNDSRYDAEADVRKADYLYLEALRRKTTGANDSHFELLRTAHRLNPADAYLSGEYGFNLTLLALASNDSANTERGLEMMREYADANSDDYYANQRYAALTSRMGRTADALAVLERMHRNEPWRSELTSNYADALAQMGDSASLAHALALTDTLERTDGRSLELSARRIQYLYMSDDTASILHEARSLVKGHPNVVQYNVFAGDVYAQFGAPDSARMWFDKAIGLDPTSGIAHYSLANFLRNNGDSTAWEQEVYSALTQPDLDVEPKVEILRQFASGLYTDSLQHPRINSLFERLVDLHPREAAIRKLYRDYLGAIGDYAGAAEQTSYALDIDPSDQQQWVSLSSLWLREEEYEKSAQAARRGLHFFPDNTTLSLIGAAALTQADSTAQALMMLRRAMETVPEEDVEQRSDILSAMGDAFYQAGVGDSSFAYYERALELNPLNMSALNNCAYHLALEGRDLDRAEDMIKEVVDRRPEESTSLDTYAWVLFKKGEYEAARMMIDKALENDSDPSAELLEHAGDIYYKDGDRTEAWQYWRKALKLDKDNEVLQRKVREGKYYEE